MEPSLTIDQPIRQGSRGKSVRSVQEWLCLHDIHTAIDGAYGPATTAAVRTFQASHNVAETGVVEPSTYELLVSPMAAVLEPITLTAGATLGEAVVSYATQHLVQHPLEIGGQNRGPWVRLYMNGNEGPEWPWCAGFATFVLKQACKSVGCPMPIGASFSCDLLASSAKAKGCFARGGLAEERARVARGSLFLNRRVAGDWVHTGIVVGVDADVFHTIEGNTNDNGDREGYEVCARVRGFKDKDFILV